MIKSLVQITCHIGLHDLRVPEYDSNIVLFFRVNVLNLIK